jgi:hypothetical protein
MARCVAASPNGMTSTGSGKRPSGDHDHPVRRRGDDLLAQQRAAAALDEIERGIDLVGAVDGEIEPVDLVQRGQTNAAAYRIGTGGFRGWHADHIEPVANTHPQQFDKMLRGRTGTEAQLHAVGHEFERAGRRLPFQFVHIHAKIAFLG